ARGSFGARLRVAEAARLRDPPAGDSPAAAATRQPARERNPEHDHRRPDRRARASRDGHEPGQPPRGPAAGRDRRDPRLRDLRRGDAPLLRDLVSADPARRLPPKAADPPTATPSTPA